MDQLEIQILKRWHINQFMDLLKFFKIEQLQT